MVLTLFTASRIRSIQSIQAYSRQLLRANAVELLTINSPVGCFFAFQLVLMHYKADVNAPDNDGNTPLHLCTANGHEKVKNNIGLP